MILFHDAFLWLCVFYILIDEKLFLSLFSLCEGRQCSVARYLKMSGHLTGWFRLISRGGKLQAEGEHGAARNENNKSKNANCEEFPKCACLLCDPFGACQLQE